MNTPRNLAVIPARMSATRLPNKPLKDIGGKTLIERVYTQASKANCFSRVVIATDSSEIEAAGKSFGADVIMTSSENLTGSDRVAEVCRIFSGKGEHYDLIANVQGDMPFINPRVIEKTVALLAASQADSGMATVATPIITRDEYERSDTVKVALGEDSSALYFSRSPIPHWRGNTDQSASEQAPFAYRHLGLYVFRPETLLKLNTFAQAFTEVREGLEQLRALANGVKIKVHIAANSELVDQVEVDTQSDLDKAREIAKR